MVNLTAVVRKDALLVCPVSGYPVTNTQWSLDNRLITGPRPQTLSNGSLMLESVEKADSALYTCTVFNKQGDSATGHVALRAIEPPKISPFTFDGDLKEGDRSQVSCTISSGDMPIQIEWHKDGRYFEAGADVQVQNNVFSSNILFFSLKAAHSGSYTCLATNAADAANFTAQLIVRGNSRNSFGKKEIPGIFAQIIGKYFLRYFCLHVWFAPVFPDDICFLSQFPPDGRWSRETWQFCTKRWPSSTVQPRATPAPPYPGGNLQVTLRATLGL